MAASTIIANPIEFRQWNQQIRSFGKATIFHTTHWAQVLHDSYGYKAGYVCTSDNGKLTGVLPIMEIRSFLTGKRGVCLPFSDSVEPLVADSDAFDALLGSAINMGRKRGWKSIAVHGGQSLFDHAPPYETYINCTIDLSTDASGLLKKIKSNTRRNIKKAEKSGIKTKICHSLESVNEFYRLNCLSRKGHGLPPQPYVFFENIYKHIIQKKLGFVCLGYSGKKIVSGVVFFVFNNKAIYKYGASDKKFLALRPNNLVFWDSLLHLLDLRINEVDLGRTELHHSGLLQFKRGWNPSESTLNYFKVDARTGNVIRQKPGVKSSYSIFSLLPVPMLKLVGRILYKHVG